MHGHFTVCVILISRAGGGVCFIINIIMSNPIIKTPHYSRFLWTELRLQNMLVGLHVVFPEAK